jgi:hypothetical protein
MRGLTFAVAVLLVGVQAVAGPIDPLGFPSLGPFTTSGSTPYSINTSGTPMLTLPGGSTIPGVVFADTPGHNLAVFDFSSINIAAGTTLTATGSLPLVLLSQGGVTIGGTIDVSGAFPTMTTFNGVPGPGAFGPGTGGNGGFGGGGGGFGGNGGASGTYTSSGMVFGGFPGGHSYGDLSVQLQGGSFGGGASAGFQGGGGGGGLEIGAVGTVHLLGTGRILANGGSSNTTGSVPGAGGGSGGGIFLHGNSIELDTGGLTSAHGGIGGFSFSNGGPGGVIGAAGGGGGGGRILIEFGSGGLVNSSSFDVSGGLGGSSGAIPGGNGQLVVGSLFPEPASLVMLSIGLAAVAGLAWRQRRTA